MRKLEKTIIGRGEVRGYTFERVYETDKMYIYAQIDNETHKIHSYEVFEKKVNELFDTESYPQSKSFGAWAWSVATLEEAMVKLKEIESRKNESI